jgi:hypothetical protein
MQDLAFILDSKEAGLIKTSTESQTEKMRLSLVENLPQRHGNLSIIKVRVDFILV